MRDIRFRARNAEIPRCWVYGYFVIENNRCSIINNEGRFKVISGTESQFTGLKDKNGKEIYEGDVLQYPGYNTKVVMEFSINGFIALPWRVEKISGSEIIGNIYENKEVLND